MIKSFFCCSLDRLTGPVGSAQAISVFFFFLGPNPLQAGEAGTLSVQLSGLAMGDPITQKHRGLVRGNILEGESASLTALLLLDGTEKWFEAPETKKKTTTKG